MTKPVFRLVLSVLLVALATGPTWGQNSQPTIESVRVGLPSGVGQSAGRARRGAWSPVYVTLKAGPEGNVREGFLLVVEAVDREEAPYRYPVLVPALAPEQRQVVCGYFRPVQFTNEVTVRLQDSSGKTLQSVKHQLEDATQEIVGSGALLFATLGASRAAMPGLVQALRSPQAKDEPLDEDDRGAKRFAFIDQADLLPDFWIGYDAVDVLILTTGQKDFMQQLLEEEGGRRQALLEWVRRGGQLMISVAGNHQLVTALLERMPGLIDVTLTGTKQRTLLRQLQGWTRGEQQLRNIEIALAQAGPRTTVLIQETPDTQDRADRPLILEGSCGLGRVLLLGFDLDRPPFTDWKGQALFWQKIQEELTPRIEARGLGEGPGFDEASQRQRLEVLSSLQRGLETFPRAPVISFGWVALFIVFYILLIGPIDYLLLKKVFKRLELTWITFPVTVIVISVVAYVVAYRSKGDDLLINKIDLVDIDLETRQAYGTTWLTLFSPRISTYTVGVAPADPEWVAPPGPDARPHPTVVSLLSSPDRETRLGTQSLFPRPYEYAREAAGVKQVPIPVWATRSFTGSWRAPLSKDRPAIEASLDFSRLDTSVPRGTITNNLPVSLEGVTLFYRGRWYRIGKLASGESRRVETLFEGGRQGQNRDQWFRTDMLRPGGGEGVMVEGFDPTDPSQSSYQVMKTLMFFADSGTTLWLNSAVRRLDQSWRLRSRGELPGKAEPRYRDEVVLVARTSMLAGESEKVTRSGETPARLWLGALPGDREERPSLPGFLAQETYVRVFIPIQRRP